MAITSAIRDAVTLPIRSANHAALPCSAAAIIWAVDHGAKVINASWGSSMESESDKTALKYAFDHDVVFVSAVGNSGNNEPNYPGASEGVIGVAATTDIDTWGSFSTYGDWVDVAAPGEGILSTFPMAKGNGYRIMRGTSMACPLVTGAAALIRSQFPQMTYTQVKARLESTAKDVIQPGKDPYAGFGRINVERAILDPVR
ncbi:MAG: S8 family serine peptidase [Candidatus Sericytochromatia bacterium]|nr:S8 family serine peptidase [Candidatus Sericytochromatia bacterium]